MKNRLIVILLLLGGIVAFHSCKKDDFPVPQATTEPGFTYTLDNDGLVPSTATFTNTTVVPKGVDSVEYYWNFGDNTTSVEVSPVHLYSTAGAYVVTLVALSKKTAEINQIQQTVLIVDPNAAGTRIFFTNGSDTYGGLINESAPIFTSLGIATGDSYGTAIDTVNKKLYVADFDGEKIIQSDLDGSNKIDFRTGIGSPDAVVIDYQEMQIYWDTDQGIRRANINDATVTQFEDFVTGQGAGDPEGMAIDQGTRTLFWNCYNVGVWKKNLNGTGETNIVPVTGGGGAIIVVGSRIIYDDYNASGDIQLKSANFDGSGTATIKTDISRVVYGLAYDPDHGKLYWGDRAPGVIMQSNLDGSNATPWYTKAGSSPRGISIGTKKD